MPVRHTRRKNEQPSNSSYNPDRQSLHSHLFAPQNQPDSTPRTTQSRLSSYRLSQLAISAKHTHHLPLQPQVKAREKSQFNEGNNAFNAPLKVHQINPTNGIESLGIQGKTQRKGIRRKIDEEDWKRFQDRNKYDTAKLSTGETVANTNYKEAENVYMNSYKRFVSLLTKDNKGQSNSTDRIDEDIHSKDNCLIGVHGKYTFSAFIENSNSDIVQLRATRNPKARKWTTNEWKKSAFSDSDQQVEYENKFNLSKGKFYASNNFADRDEATYGEGRMMNSEIIYLQTQQAIELAEKLYSNSENKTIDTIKKLKRTTVINPETLTTMLFTEPGKVDETGFPVGKGDLKPAYDKEAVLGTPNGLAACWLVKQHGGGGKGQLPTEAIGNVKISYSDITIEIDLTIGRRKTKENRKE